MRKQPQPEEPVTRIDLDKVLTTPVIDIIVRLDTRTNDLDLFVFGIPGISSFDVRRILEAAKEKLEREELERLTKEAEDAQKGSVHLAGEQAG